MPLDVCARRRLSDAPARRRAPPLPVSHVRNLWVWRSCFSVWQRRLMMPLVGGADLTAPPPAIRTIYGPIAHIDRVRPAYHV
eukprot:6173220-Pleurochrysis_carterae.AAC.2